MSNRLPLGWSREQHVCGMPRYVYFTPELGDIWECPHCHSSWKVTGFEATGWDSYDRYELWYTLLPVRNPQW